MLNQQMLVCFLDGAAVHPSFNEFILSRRLAAPSIEESIGQDFFELGRSGGHAVGRSDAGVLQDILPMCT